MSARRLNHFLGTFTVPRFIVTQNFIHLCVCFSLDVNQNFMYVTIKCLLAYFIKLFIEHSIIYNPRLYLIHILAYFPTMTNVYESNAVRFHFNLSKITSNSKKSCI